MSRVISVLGGTGRVGREVCRLANAQGHIVIALGRERGRLDERLGRVQLIDGEATDAATVDRAVAPADSVVSVLGHVQGSPRDLLVQAMQHTIAAMERHNVHRIVLLAPIPRTDPSRPAPPLSRLVDRLRPRSAQQDATEAAALLMDSDLDWTVVRVRRLVRRLGEDGHAETAGDGEGTAVSHRVAAAFLLDCAAGDAYLHGSPLLTEAINR